MLLWLNICIIVVVFIYVFGTAVQPEGRARIPNLKEALPSSALIDQYLPIEVLDNIILQLDLHSYAQCRAVSKYWRSICTNFQLERILLDTETRNIRTRFEALVETQQLQNKLNFKNFWTEYSPDDESTSERLSDLICAMNLNKTLLDVQPRALNELLTLKIRSIIDVAFKPYLIKVKAYTNETDRWQFYTASKNFSFKPHKTLPWIDSRKNGGNAQIVMKLYEYLMLQRHTNMNLVFFRILEPLKWILGIFPNDTTYLGYLTVSFLVPQSIPIYNRIFPEVLRGIFPFLAMTMNKIGATMDPAYIPDNNNTNQFFSRQRILSRWTVLGIIGTILLYPYSMGIFAHVLSLQIIRNFCFKSIKIRLQKPTLQRWQKQTTAVIFAIIFLAPFNWPAIISRDDLFQVLLSSAPKLIFAEIYSLIDTCLLDYTKSDATSFATILQRILGQSVEYISQLILAMIAVTLYQM